MAVIRTTEDYEEWLAGLLPRERREVLRVVTLLEQLGVQLPFPHSSALEGSRYPLRELRPKRGDSPLRPIYAFDPRRDAVLLLGGDKSNSKRFYERIIPKVERLWEDHLADLADEDAKKDDDES
jgi:hypothetical protein